MSRDRPSLTPAKSASAPKRIYVERAIYERFVAALTKKAKEIQIGDPWDEMTEMGPLISEKHRQKVLSYYALAKQEGAQVHSGGGVPELSGAQSGGWYIEPTSGTGLAQNSPVYAGGSVRAGLQYLALR